MFGSNISRTTLGDPEDGVSESAKWTVKSRKEESNVIVNPFKAARWEWLATALFLLAVVLSPAQETRGTIGGKVFDSSGAVIPGATVTAVNAATNVSIKTETNADGSYVVPFLLPGVYRVTASAPGFKTVKRDGVELRIHDNLQVDMTLDVGAVSEQVEVSAETPLLEAATANLGQVLDSRRISELPIPHGSPYSLIYLTPGVVNVYPGGMTYQTPTELNASSTMINVNGAPMGSTDFTVDGVPNTQTSNANYGGGISNSPPADLVQEFKIETAFDAGVGHTSGTVVNLSLKAGANRPHGTAYWFNREPGWNANSFFANKYGQEKGQFRYDRWGATLNGPIYIPKLYKGKDRTFFSYGYEGMYNELVWPITDTVPDPKYYGGDFSSLLKLDTRYQIYDPATIRPAPNGRFSIQPFPGNVIPQNRISPMALKVLQHYPQPNATGTADGRNNYSQQARPEPVKYFNHIARIDHVISDKQRMFFRSSISRKIDGPYRNYWDDMAVGNNYIGKTRQFALDDVYTFSPTLILNARYGYTRYAGGHFPRRLGFDLSQLGFTPEALRTIGGVADLFPRFDVSGIESIGYEGYDVLNNDVHALFASVTKQHSSHNIRIGADLRAYRDNVFYYGHATGRYTYGTNYTRGPFDNSPAAPGGVGQGLASLLLGIPTGGYIDRNDSEAIQSTYWAFYLHDNWRTTRKLTLDLGLRWEYEGPVTERFDRAVRGFDPNAAQAIEDAAKAAYAAAPDPALPGSQFQVRGGLRFAGRGGQPRTFWDKRFSNFAPRIGFAYQALPKIVLRGGYGIFPIQIGQPAQNRSYQPGFSQRTNVIPTLDNGQTFLASISNPFPSGLPPAPGASQGIATFIGRSIGPFYNTAGLTPYTQRWNFNVQLLLPGQTLLEVGYLGSKSIKLQADRELNGIPLQYLSRSPFRDQVAIDFLTANVPNPLAGLLPGTSLNGATISRAQLLSPYPHFSSVVMRDSQGSSWHDAMTVRAERRFRNGFTTLLGYTWSKVMDATEYLNAADPVPCRTISTFDRTHHIGLSGIYELPFGRGRALGGGVHPALNYLIGGWQLGAVWQYTSGEPLGFGNAIFLGNLKDIPLPSSQRSAERWLNTDAGFLKDSSKQLAYNLRMFPIRFSGVRSGSYNVWDMSLLKNTKIREVHEVQFRAEFLNAFNHTTGFAPPDTDPTSSSFGQVFSSYANPRIVQFGLKYLF